MMICSVCKEEQYFDPGVETTTCRNGHAGAPELDPCGTCGSLYCRGVHVPGEPLVDFNKHRPGDDCPMHPNLEEELVNHLVLMEASPEKSRLLAIIQRWCVSRK